MNKIKNTTLQIRISPDLKESVEDVLDSLGISTSQAVNMFFTQIALRREIPFKLGLPKYNAETIRAIEEINSMIADKSTEKYSTVEELFTDLGI
jgi:DNA-damage-inducible protein J